jgi:hypothetical protein
MSANENELNRLYEKTCEMVDAKYPSWKSYVDYPDGQKVHIYVSKNGFRIKVSYQEQSIFYGRIITPGYVCLSFLNVNLWCKADKESKQIRQQTMDSVKQLDKALGN